MNGPFPGMDPWLETRWSDFHTAFIVYLRDVVRPLLPADLQVQIQTDDILEPVGGAVSRRFEPDAHLHVGESSAVYRSEGGTAVAEEPIAAPTRVTEHLPARQRSLHIVDESTGGELVTSIELLSPTNKRPGIGLRAYREKQSATVAAGVNLLELDLLRGGRSTTLAARDGIDPADASPHHVSLFHAVSESVVELYAIQLEDRLPKVALPLRSGEDPIAVSLQAALEEAKVRGDYARRMAYAADPPGPPLTAEERAWVDERVAAWRAATENA